MRWLRALITPQKSTLPIDGGLTLFSGNKIFNYKKTKRLHAKKKK